MSGRAGMDTGVIPNLDDIQEVDASAQPSRAGALVLASIAGACIVLAGAFLMRSPSKPKPTEADPLGDLVARARTAAPAVEKPVVAAADVTFPTVLSDTKNTTALEVVRDAKAGAAAAAPLPFALPPGAPTEPPPATDRLPVVPLPAQDVLRSPVESSPSDKLTAVARRVARDDVGEASPPGGPGGYQLQVSSFKTQAEADAFALALRRRGHRAYVEPAQVKGRGLWFRVRIGPFKYRHAAVIYRQDFEAKERMVTFIVDPPKTTVKIRPAFDE